MTWAPASTYIKINSQRLKKSYGKCVVSSAEAVSDLGDEQAALAHRLLAVLYVF